MVQPPLKMQARTSELSHGGTTEVAEPVAVGSAHADISHLGRYFNPQVLKEDAIHSQDSTSWVQKGMVCRLTRALGAGMVWGPNLPEMTRMNNLLRDKKQ